MEEIEDMRDRGYTIEQIAEITGVAAGKIAEILEIIDKIKGERQAKGIEEAKARGVKFGRRLQYGKDEQELKKAMEDYDKRWITWQEAAKKLGIEKKSTFFYRYYQWKGRKEN